MKARSLLRTKSLQDILVEVKSNEAAGNSLKRTLNVRDLTAFGIAAVVGAGIFSTIGNAAAEGGPAISLLFIFTAVACGFATPNFRQWFRFPAVLTHMPIFPWAN